MNKLTQDIAKWLGISIESAKTVQHQLECNGIDFSECSERTLKKEAKAIWGDSISRPIR